MSTVRRGSSSTRTGCARCFGPDVANEALRRWLRQGGEPAEALAIGRRLPAAMPSLSYALEVLL